MGFLALIDYNHNYESWLIYLSQRHIYEKNSTHLQYSDFLLGCFPVYLINNKYLSAPRNYAFFLLNSLRFFIKTNILQIQEFLCHFSLLVCYLFREKAIIRTLSRRVSLHLKSYGS
jgi:hypothetical protein